MRENEAKGEDFGFESIQEETSRAGFILMLLSSRILRLHVYLATSLFKKILHPFNDNIYKELKGHKESGFSVRRISNVKIHGGK